MQFFDGGSKVDFIIVMRMLVLGCGVRNLTTELRSLGTGLD